MSTFSRLGEGRRVLKRDKKGQQLENTSSKVVLQLEAQDGRPSMEEVVNWQMPRKGKKTKSWKGWCWAFSWFLKSLRRSHGQAPWVREGVG